MKRRVITVRLTEEIRDLLSLTVVKSGRTLSELVREAINYWLEKREIVQKKKVEN